MKNLILLNNKTNINKINEIKSFTLSTNDNNVYFITKNGFIYQNQKVFYNLYSYYAIYLIQLKIVIIWNGNGFIILLKMKIYVVFQKMELLLIMMLD